MRDTIEAHKLRVQVGDLGDKIEKLKEALSKGEQEKDMENLDLKELKESLEETISEKVSKHSGSTRHKGEIVSDS